MILPGAPYGMPVPCQGFRIPIARTTATRMSTPWRVVARDQVLSHSRPPLVAFYQRVRAGVPLPAVHAAVSCSLPASERAGPAQVWLLESMDGLVRPSACPANRH